MFLRDKCSVDFISIVSPGFRYQGNVGLKVSWEVLPPLLFLEEFENWLLIFASVLVDLNQAMRVCRLFVDAFIIDSIYSMYSKHKDISAVLSIPQKRDNSLHSSPSQLLSVGSSGQIRFCPSDSYERISTMRITVPTEPAGPARPPT